ncbi:MAG: MoaD/ThiS family protein [Actinomycetota bacterium]
MTIRVRLPGSGDEVVVEEPVASIADLRAALFRRHRSVFDLIEDNSLVMAVDGVMVMCSEDSCRIRDGDVVDLVVAGR